MAFSRLLVVTALVTMLGGAFGASVGGLLGYAVPSSLSLFFGSESHLKMTPASPEGTISEPTGRKVQVGVDPQSHLAGQGMALGGAFGLVVGAILGFMLGIVDQVLHLVRGIFGGRKEQPRAVAPVDSLAHRLPPAA